MAKKLNVKSAKGPKSEPLKKVADQDRVQLLLLSGEVRVANAEQALARAELESLLASIDKDGRITASMTKVNDAVTRHQLTIQKYTAYVRGVEKKLNMSFAGLAMNPETGVIHPISEGTQYGLPVSPDDKPTK